MKKIPLYFLASLIIFSLAACSTPSAGRAPAPVKNGTPVQPTEKPVQRNLPQATQPPVPAEPAAGDPLQLILGTFKLEGTGQAVSAEQAGVLLPLWTSLKDMAQDGAATQEQVEDLLQEIQDAMTDEQNQAVSKMQFTREDMLAILETQGISVETGPGQGGGMSPQQGAQPPAGGTPPGSQQPVGGVMPTPQAGQSGPGGPQGHGGNILPVPPELIEALIQMLKEKAGWR